MEELCYLYNEDGEFVSSAQVIKHPFGFADMLPNNATRIVPPETKEGFIVKFSTDYNAWVYDKILTEDEKKVSGEIELVDGEYINDGILVIVPEVSKLHTWNKELCVYELDTFKFETYKKELYTQTSVIMDKALEDGTYFEENKLIKGRDKDLSRAHAMCDGIVDGAIQELTWYFSNGVEELVSDKDRMQAIYGAIGFFLNSCVSKAGVIKKQIYAITDYAELLEFDVSTEWNK